MRLPVNTAATPLSGPPELTRQTLNPLVDAPYAGNLKPDKTSSFGTYGGRSWDQAAVRSSVGDAYAYNIETNAYQVADDLERLARAGYTEIHIATGTHGWWDAVLTPESQFLMEDALSIRQTMNRHPGLKIIPYDMSDPLEAGIFDAAQAQAAEGKLSGGATHAAFCYSRNRVLDPNPDPAGPYASVELLDRTGGLAPQLGMGGLIAGMGAWSVYTGLDDPNPYLRAAKVTSGGMQVIGGASYALGYATDSIPLAKFGSTAGKVGGAAGQALMWIDIYREMNRKFDPNAPPMTSEDSLEMGLKVAAAIFPELALHVIAFHYGVRPAAEAASEYLTPMFIGGISEAYGIPSQYLWGMYQK